MPVTARLYTDLSFMTSDNDIASDVSDVFNLLTGYSEQREYRKLLVAPVNLARQNGGDVRKEASTAPRGTS